MLDIALAEKKETERDELTELTEKYSAELSERQRLRGRETIDGVDGLIEKSKMYGILEDGNLPATVLTQLEEAVQKYQSIMDKAVFGEKDIEKKCMRFWERGYHTVLGTVSKKSAENYLTRKKAEAGKRILNSKIEQLTKARSYFTSKIIGLNNELEEKINARARQRTTFDVANTLRIREYGRIKELDVEIKDLYSDQSKTEQMENEEAQDLSEIIEAKINEKEREREEAESNFYAGVSGIDVAQESVEAIENSINQTKFLKAQFRSYKRAVDKQERRLKIYVDMITKNPLAIDGKYITDINTLLKETDGLIDDLSRLTVVKNQIVESVPKAREPVSSIFQAEVKSNDDFYKKMSVDIEKLNTAASRKAEDYKVRRINRINQQL